MSNELGITTAWRSHSRMVLFSVSVFRQHLDFGDRQNHLSRMLTPTPPNRSRLPHNHRRLHRQPCNRQAHQSIRNHLVLPLWFRRRHTSRCRYCAIPAGTVRDGQRQAPDDTDGCCYFPGNRLFQQGPVDVRCLFPFFIGTHVTFGFQLTDI